MWLKWENLDFLAPKTNKALGAKMLGKSRYLQDTNQFLNHFEYENKKPNCQKLTDRGQKKKKKNQQNSIFSLGLGKPFCKPQNFSYGMKIDEVTPTWEFIQKSSQSLIESWCSALQCHFLLEEVESSVSKYIIMCLQKCPLSSIKLR